MGRVSVDLYPEQIGVVLADVSTFSKSLGGSATNVAVQAARLGRRTALVTRVGDDGFGLYVRKALAGFGVDARWVSTDPDLRTPLVFCEIFPPDSFPLLFYRQPTAPDMTIAPADLDLAAIAAAPLFWATGSGLYAEPSRAATLAALAARARRDFTVLDLDYRPVFWSGVDEARAWAEVALEAATVVVGNQEEVNMAVGTRDPRLAAQRLLDRGVRLAVVKQGPLGVLARTADEEVQVPPIPIQVVCGLGAGDAFGGALCHGLLAGWDLPRMLRFANAAGAIVASRLACAYALPGAAEVDELLATTT